MEMPRIDLINRFKDMLRRLLRLYHPDTLRSRGMAWAIGLVLVTATILFSVLGVIWSREPAPFAINTAALELQGSKQDKLVTGQRTAAALITVAQTLLDKPGGYLSNDVTPPGALLDNIPNWEFGALVQIRDLAKSLRNDMSRSQSQSLEDPDLAAADPLFNFDNDSWLFPPSEREYRKGIEHLKKYSMRLANGKNDTNFYARADNLREWLSIVEKRLGGLSQRLSASIGQERINTNLAGDSAATQSSAQPSVMMVKTPWSEIDDVFFEARGSAWALLHFLKAVEIDFSEVLQKKNALVSLRQIIRELESTQDQLWSPVILNGSGFGFVTNHSLIMASYISRANAAVIDLRNLLQQG